MTYSEDGSKGGHVTKHLDQQKGGTQLPEKPRKLKNKLRLSVDLDAYYAKAYANIASKGGFGLASRIQHRHMERYDPELGATFTSVIEVGAGQGQHISFVDTNHYSEYIQTDIRPPANAVEYQGTWVETSVEATSLPFCDDRFDRLIATCVLAHTADPQKTLKEWHRVVRPGGLITLYLPTDPNPVLSFLRMIGPSQSRIREGFDPRIIYLDHRYQYRYLKSAVELEFESNPISVSRFPRFMPWWMSVWEILQIRV